MGRTTVRIVPFLKEGLAMKKYINLGFEEDGVVFFLDLPRYKQGMNPEYGFILKDWCRLNSQKYKGYSKAKGVLKAVTKKSVYVISLPRHGNRLRFHLASKEEEAEKRRQQKEGSAVVPNEDIPSIASSGYDSTESNDDTMLHHNIPDQQVDLLNNAANPNTSAKSDSENYPEDLNLHLSSEKRRHQKEGSAIVLNDDLPSIALSGYHSAESNDYTMTIPDQQVDLLNNAANPNTSAKSDSKNYPEDLSSDIDWDTVFANLPDVPHAEWDALLRDLPMDPPTNLGGNTSLINIAVKDEQSVAVCQKLDPDKHDVKLKDFGAGAEYYAISKRWNCTSRVYFGSIEQYIFEPISESVFNPDQHLNCFVMEIHPELAIELILPAEWLAEKGKTCQKFDFISGKSPGEIFLLMYFT